jgi:hypothetical protein
MLLSEQSFSIIELNDHLEFGTKPFYSTESALEIIDIAA